MSIKFSYNQEKPEYLSIRFIGNSAYHKFKIQDVQSQAIALAGGIAKVITLEEKDQSKLPSLVYFVDGVEFLGQSELLNGQQVELVAESGDRTTGRIIIPGSKSAIEEENNDEESQRLSSIELQHIQSTIDELYPDLDFIIIKTDKKENSESRYKVVLMDGAGQTAEDDEDMKDIMLQLMPNPLDPEMLEEDSGRILISDEVLMTQILCKIKDLIRDDIQAREKVNSDTERVSSVKNHQNTERNQRSESRLLSPKRIERIQAEEEEVEIQDFSVIARNNTKIEVIKILVQTEKNKQSDEPKIGSEKSYDPTPVTQAKAEHQLMIDHQSADEQVDTDYLEAKKENLWERLRRLMKKKHSLLEKKLKNEEIIEVEVTKIEIKKEQALNEKKLLEEQKKSQIEKFSKKPLLAQSAVEVFEKEEAKLEEKEQKILTKESKLMELVQEITEETEHKLHRVEVEIVEVEEELAKIEDMQKSQFSNENSYSQRRRSLKSDSKSHYSKSGTSSRKAEIVSSQDQYEILETKPEPVLEQSEVYWSVH